MKKIWRVALASCLWLTGCAKHYTITDNMTLYPDNQAAEKWGVLRFYSQYPSKMPPAPLNIRLADGEMLTGQLRYMARGGQWRDESPFLGNVSWGIGVGRHVNPFWGLSLSPRYTRYQSDVEKVMLNAQSSQHFLNCEGEFNRAERIGSLHCHGSGDKQFRGTINRVAVVDNP